MTINKDAKEMKQHWYERFKMWLCRHFGHVPMHKQWKHNEHTFDVCKRCKCVYDLEKK